VTTNQQLDALIRRVDVEWQPDPAFVEASRTNLMNQVRASRAADQSWLGRLDSRIRLRIFVEGPSEPVRLVAFAALLVLAILAGLLVAGALLRPAPLGNGLLIVSVQGQLEAIDPAGGPTRRLGPEGEVAEGVSRSPDGRTATFWLNDAGISRLFAIDVDGANRRELATGMTLTWNGGIDTWSNDSRTIATEVTLRGKARIVAVDVASGAVHAVTPAEVEAHNPLWSPDDRWLAFTPETAAGRGLSIISIDGTGMRDVAGDLNGLEVSGADTWSPDGEWIYFNAGDSDESHVFRANVPGRFSQQLTGQALRAAATASSPDGAQIAFMVDAAYGFDLWVAASDGRGARRILQAAGLGGWSSDGQLILVRWKPRDPSLGGLATIRPDGTGLMVLVPFDESCRKGWDESCLSGFGWGQARP
jgi:Tol biopolymer transport system component